MRGCPDSRTSRPWPRDQHSSISSGSLLLETLETQREDESVLDYLFFIRDSLFALFSPSSIASVILAASTVDRSWKKKLKSGHIKVFDTIKRIYCMSE